MARFDKSIPSTHAPPSTQAEVASAPAEYLRHGFCQSPAGGDVTLSVQEQALHVIAEEKRRIGNELHDDVQQQLTGLGLLAQSLSDELSDEGSIEAEMAARLASGILDVAHHVQLLARGLIPQQIDAKVFHHALQQVAIGVSQHGVRSCRVDCAAEPADDHAATQLYHIAQEAVNNAVKHSGASEIVVSLYERDAALVMIVTDNGNGFAQQVQQVPPDGMGLRIMEYRAGLLDGTLQVEPAVPRGTAVICRLPLAGRRMSPENKPLPDARALPAEQQTINCERESRRV